MTSPSKLERLGDALLLPMPPKFRWAFNWTFLKVRGGDCDHIGCAIGVGWATGIIRRQEASADGTPQAWEQLNMDYEHFQNIFLTARTYPAPADSNSICDEAHWNSITPQMVAAKIKQYLKDHPDHADV